MREVKSPWPKLHGDKQNSLESFRNLQEKRISKLELWGHFEVEYICQDEVFFIVINGGISNNLKFLFS